MKSNVILIDFENVQPKELGCLRGKPFETKVFCGAHQSKIVELASQLQPLGSDVSTSASTAWGQTPSISTSPTTSAGAQLRSPGPLLHHFQRYRL